MNQAQLQLVRIANNLKSPTSLHYNKFSSKEKNNMLMLLRHAFKIWEPYCDRNYSTPHFQLKSIEKRYGITISSINDYFGRL